MKNMQFIYVTKGGHLIKKILEEYHDEVGFGGGTTSDYACVALPIAAEDVIQEVFDLVVEDEGVGIILRIAVIELVLAILAQGQSPASPNHVQLMRSTEQK